MFGDSTGQKTQRLAGRGSHAQQWESLKDLERSQHHLVQGLYGRQALERWVQMLGDEEPLALDALHYWKSLGYGT